MKFQILLTVSPHLWQNCRHICDKVWPYLDKIVTIFVTKCHHIWSFYKFTTDFNNCAIFCWAGLFLKIIFVWKSLKHWLCLLHFFCKFKVGWNLWSPLLHVGPTSNSPLWRRVPTNFCSRTKYFFLFGGKWCKIYFLRHKSLIHCVCKLSPYQNIWKSSRK